MIFTHEEKDEKLLDFVELSKEGKNIFQRMYELLKKQPQFKDAVDV